MTDTASPGGADIRKLRCSCGRLRHAARRITHIYDEAMSKADLKITQYSILTNVARLDGATITDLARRLVLDRSTLSRNLAPLEAAGLVVLGPGPDGRSRQVRITEAGRVRYLKARDLWEATERKFRTEFGEEETIALHGLLDRVVDRIED